MVRVFLLDGEKKGQSKINLFNVDPEICIEPNKRINVLHDDLQSVLTAVLKWIHLYFMVCRKTKLSFECQSSEMPEVLIDYMRMWIRLIGKFSPNPSIGSINSLNRTYAPIEYIHINHVNSNPCDMIWAAIHKFI